MRLVALLVILVGLVQGQVMAETITVDVNKKYQVWEGFGASGGWWPHYVADFPADKREQMIDYLYTKKGIDMEIYRYNIPAGGAEDIHDPLRRTLSIVGPDGKIDVSRDVKGIQILKEIYAKGVRKFVAFSNSPPTSMTINSLASGGEKGGSNLKPECERDYARFLIEVCRQLQVILPDSQLTLSPINEPQWTWGKDHRSQEGCHYTPEQVRDVFHVLIEELEKTDIKIDLEGPESGEWKSSQQFVDAMLKDELIAKNMTHIAIHSYWSNTADREKFAPYMAETYPNHKLVMSEYCQMEHGHNLTIESGLNLANCVYEDMTICNVVSWQWWLCIAPGGYCDGLVYANRRTELVETTKRMYTLGQFSRYIKPGWQRIECKSDGKSRPVAFISADQKQIAVVIINNESTSEKIVISKKGWDGAIKSVSVTDADHELTAIQDAQKELELPGKSVVTIVYDAK